MENEGAAITWNGSSGHVSAPPGCKLYFAERGFFYRDGFRLDSAGVNAKSSLADFDVSPCTRRPLRIRPGYLLVLLQDEGYLAAAGESPNFSGNACFLSRIVENSALPVVVRPHPQRQPNRETAEIVHDSARWDYSPTLGAALDGAAAVATISSSAAIAAIRRGLPVLCYGAAVYAKPGVAWIMDGSPLQTWARTRQIAAGHCDLNREAQKMFVHRLAQTELRTSLLPNCILPRLAAAFTNRFAPDGAGEKYHDRD